MSETLLTIRVGLTVCMLLGAVILAALKREGWGWFLFIAFLMLSSLSA